MTPQKTKQMQTALLATNALLTEILADPAHVSLVTVRKCLERNREALKVEVVSKS